MNLLTGLLAPTNSDTPRFTALARYRHTILMFNKHEICRSSGLRLPVPLLFPLKSFVDGILSYVARLNFPPRQLGKQTK